MEGRRRGEERRLGGGTITKGGCILLYIHMYMCTYVRCMCTCNYRNYYSMYSTKQLFTEGGRVEGIIYGIEIKTEGVVTCTCACVYRRLLKGDEKPNT